MAQSKRRRITYPSEDSESAAMDDTDAGRITETSKSSPEAREISRSNQDRSSPNRAPDEVVPGDLTEADAAPYGKDSRTAPPSAVPFNRYNSSHQISTHYTEEELEKYCRYNMNHKKRGIALIFNHEKFKMKSLSQRSGAAEDGRALSDTMEHLGFDVRLHKDKDLDEMREIFSEVAKQDHANHDCLVVAIMTHGEENGILFAADYQYKANEVWDMFKSEKVPSLAGKPKIFLFQACRGRKMEESTVSFDTTDSGSGRSFILPSNSDFLMLYSTMEGYYSWRNTSEGSWLIQDLCKELKKDARTKDILSILTNTLRRVAFTRFSATPGKPDMHKRQQMPIFSSTLTKFLYFDETSI